MRAVIIFSILFLWNIQTSLAQTTFAGSMKIYLTWIKIKAEKGKKSGANFDICNTAILSPCKYKKTDYFNGRFDFSNTEARDISLVQVRNSSGAGNDVTPNDYMLDLHMGKSGNKTGFLNQNPIGGVTDVQSLVIDGAAALAGTIIIAALAGASGGNPEIDLSKAHVHRKEPSTNNNEKLDSRPLKGLQLNESPSGFSFTPLRDTVVDIDGNVYSTAALGAMVIMAEDLRVKHFHNGKEIPKMKDNVDRNADNIPAYCNYTSDSGITAVKEVLYNWYAVNDTSWICPKNWHVPSYGEWTSIITCLGGTSQAAGKLIESFSGAGKVCQWWSSTRQDTGRAQSLNLDRETKETKLTVTDWNSGLPVRCIRDY